MLTRRKGRANLEVMNELGRFCRQLRLQKGLTLQEVASHVQDRLNRKVGWTTIRAIETGESRRPARDLLDALAWLYDTPVELFIMKAYAAHPEVHSAAGPVEAKA